MKRARELHLEMNLATKHLTQLAPRILKEKTTLETEHQGTATGKRTKP